MVNETEIYDELIDEFAKEGVVPGKMFGSIAFMLNGKAVGCFKNGVGAFKLGTDSPVHADALAIEGAELFDPSGKHRPFKDWVALPFTEAAHFPRLLEAAISAARER